MLLTCILETPGSETEDSDRFFCCFSQLLQENATMLLYLDQDHILAPSFLIVIHSLNSTIDSDFMS